MKIDPVLTVAVLLGVTLAISWTRWALGLGMKKGTVALIAITVGVTPYVAHRNLRLGRDILFYGSSPSHFTLPSGIEVSVGRWYFRDQLLAEDQHFARVESPDSPVADYLSVSGRSPNGLAQFIDDDGVRRNLLILIRQDHVTRGDKMMVGGGLPAELEAID